MEEGGVRENEREREREGGWRVREEEQTFGSESFLARPKQQLRNMASVPGSTPFDFDSE